MEPKENLIADAMLQIMQQHMPNYDDVYVEASMLWGFIWQEMRIKAEEILREETHG
jgi:hypothetical protein